MMQMEERVGKQNILLKAPTSESRELVIEKRSEVTDKQALGLWACLGV